MRNVALICLDTVRQDYFHRFATRLQERAELFFSQCRSASSWSVPSHASMFTGELPHQHGIHTQNRDFSDLSRKDTFLGELPHHQALGTSANVWAGSSFGFDSLFDDFSDVSPDRRFPEGLDVAQFGQQCEAKGVRRRVAFVRAALTDDHPFASLANGGLVQFDNWFSQLPVPNPFDDGASIIAREARSQITANAEPFFLFANFMDAHGPLSHVRGYDRSLHDAPLAWTSEDIDWRSAIERNDEKQLNHYKGLYGASIDYLDRKVCEFIDWLEANTDQDTTVVITSDHGDEMGTETDEKRWGHVDSSLSEGLLHVPLLIINPPPGWEEIDESKYVSHLSLPDLLIGLANDEIQDITNESIIAERIGHSGRLATIDEHRGTEADRMIRAVYRGDTKYVWDSQDNREVYRLDSSKACWQTLVEDDFEPSKFNSYFDHDLTSYKNRTETDSKTAEIDEATRDRLEELGYV